VDVRSRSCRSSEFVVHVNDADAARARDRATNNLSLASWQLGDVPELAFAARDLDAATLSPDLPSEDRGRVSCHDANLDTASHELTPRAGYPAVRFSRLWTLTQRVGPSAVRAGSDPTESAEPVMHRVGCTNTIDLRVDGPPPSSVTHAIGSTEVTLPDGHVGLVPNRRMKQESTPIATGSAASTVSCGAAHPLAQAWRVDGKPP
jgi:hypothetical protein